MHVFVGPYTVSVSVDQRLNTGNSNSGLRKKKYYLKRDKIGLTSCCIFGPDTKAE